MIGHNDAVVVQSKTRKQFEKPRRLPNEEYRRIFSRVPRVCVDLIIKDENLGVVLVKRTIPPALGQWHLPGGGVLFGETLEEAVLRIAQNEIGIQVEVNKLAGVTDFFSDNVFGHDISLAFLVSPKSLDLRGSEQGENPAFFKTLPFPLVDEHKELLITLNYFE